MQYIELVKEVMTAIGNTPPNTLTANEAARRVAAVVKAVYFEEAADGDWPRLNITGRLESISDPTRPTIMKLPDEVEDMHSLRYEVTDTTVSPKRKFEKLTYLDWEDFQDYVLARDSESSNVEEELTPDGIEMLVLNDQFPKYWTTTDDRYIIMDAYRSDLSATLLASKTQFFGKKIPVWQSTELFEIPIPVHMEPQLLAACVARASTRMKQVVSPDDVAVSRRTKARSRRKGARTDAKGYQKKTWGRH